LVDENDETIRTSLIFVSTSISHCLIGDISCLCSWRFQGM